MATQSYAPGSTMDLLTVSDLRELTSQSGLCVSLCMPAHHAGVETLQDPIRLKNLLRIARSQLRGLGLEAAMIHQILTPAASLVEDYDFWQHQCEGLAIYCSPGFFRLFRVPLSLPELAVVATRFHLKPLLSMLVGNAHFYVLALSQNRARLFRASRDQISELELPAMPAQRSEAIVDRDRGGSLQSHSVGSGARRASVFHGQGEDEKKERLTAYFRLVDQSVRDALSKDPGPLILAGVDYLFPLYRQISTLPQVLEDAVCGNVDSLTPRELLEKAVPIALAYFSKAEDRAADQLNHLLHTGMASSDLPTVLNAASLGRVQSLFVAVGVQMWGVYKPEEREVVMLDAPTPEAEDLLNLAAMYTYMNSGEVFAVQSNRVPGGGNLAAAFRY